jgi:dTDP-4-amino-4,6-dideoxygalactose transaminase/RimJ/RimL family protein N-acetyltransferase
MPEPAAIPVCRPSMPESVLPALQDCLESGWIGYGPRCAALERRFEARGGFALATANCTAALYLAARVCEDPERDEVLVPAMSFVSTAMAFRFAGMNVKLIDVDPHTGLLDAGGLERAIGPRTRAIVVVHLFGQRAPIEAARETCDRHGLLLVEDCAHRIDLPDEAMPLGDIACYSFNAVKEAPAGEGGLLWCRDAVFMERARSVSNVGLTIDTPTRARSLVHADYGFSREIGLKLRGNDLAATLATVGLDVLADSRCARRRIFEAYAASLRGSEVIVPLVRSADDSFLMCVLRVQPTRRQQVRDSLAGLGIATSIHYPSLSRHPLFASDVAPNAERLDAALLTVPCFPGMTPQQVDRVASGLAQAASERETARGGSWPHFATEGVVASGQGIVLAWPEPHEYDAITDLRNRESTSKWFMDRRKLDRMENRHYLAHGMRRGPEGLLVIRHEGSQRFLGTIGWSDLSPDQKVASFGRLMVDAHAVLESFGRIPRGEPGVAIRAAVLLRDYAFEVMGLAMLTTWYLADNEMAARVNAAVGMEIEGQSMRRGADGEPIATTQLRLSRHRWQELRRKV